MPSIPFIQNERSIPGTSGGAYAPSEDPVSAAIVRGGALATKEADQFMGVLTSQKHWEDAQARAEQNAQRHVEALTFGHDLKNDVDTIAESYKGRTDYQKFEEDGQKALDSLKAKYDGAITDPVVKRVFMPTFLQESYNLQKTIRDKKNEVLTEAGKGQWIIERDQALNNWVNAGTPEEKQTIADQFELTTQALVVSRILKPAEAEIAIKNFKSKAELAYAKELGNTEPTRLLAELNDKAKLTNIDPITRQELIKQTAAAVRVFEKDQLVTDTLVKLKQDYPDVQQRIAVMETPEFIKSLGPQGAEVQNTLMSSTLREWKIQEDNYNKFAAQKVGAASVKIMNNQPLGGEDLAGLQPHDLAMIEKVRDYQTRQNRAELNARKAEQRASLYDEKVAKKEKSDSISGNITMKMFDPAAPVIDVRNDIYGMVPKGLDIGEANRLAALAGNIKKDPAFTLGTDVIKKAGLDPISQGKAVLDLRQRVDEEKATGKRIIDIAEEIVKPKKENAVKEWLKNIFSFSTADSRKKAVSPAGGPTQADLEYTAKKHGITVEEVKKRIGAR